MKNSLIIKELGFNEPCLAYYDAWNGESHLIITDETSSDFLIRFLNLFRKKECESYTQDYIEYLGGFCTAPLKSQVFEFFRSKYGLYHVVHRFKHKKDTPEEFLSEVSGKVLNANDDLDLGTTLLYHSTYEEAKEQCINKLIEIGSVTFKFKIFSQRL